MKFKDIRTVNGIEYVAVQHGKTGTKILIPKDLQLASISYSVRDIVNLCRDQVASPYLLHHYKNVGNSRRAKQIAANKLSDGFADAMKSLEIDWG